MPSAGRASRSCGVVHSAVGWVVEAVEDAARADLQHHQHIHDAKRHGHRDDEVAGDDLAGVILQKRGPALIASVAGMASKPAQVLANGPGGDLNPQLDEKLVRDALLAPQRVLAMHPTNQIAQNSRNLRPADPRSYAPEESGEIALPADQSSGRDGDERGSPREDAGEKRKGGPLRIGGAPWLGTALDVERELSPEKQVLGPKGSRETQMKRGEANDRARKRIECRQIQMKTRKPGSSSI